MTRGRPPAGAPPTDGGGACPGGAALVAQVRRGEPGAFERIYAAHRAPLTQFVARKVGDARVAEDIVHDVFLNIWTRSDTWAVRGDIRTYLFTAARNRAWSHHARQRVRQRHAAEAGRPPEAVEAEAVDRLHAADLGRAVGRWMDELPDRRREVFELSRYEHLTYQQIADRLGLSVKTVETQMGRALRHLRGRLAAFESGAGG